MYTPNLIRSSVVPHTIASETAQKTNWKNHFDSIVALDRSITGSRVIVRHAVRDREVGQWVKKPLMADDAAGRPAEGEHEADGPPGDRGDREVREDLRDHRAGVLRAREADLQEGEPGLHEHDERARHDHPGGVHADAQVELAGDRLLQVCGVGRPMPEQQHGRQRHERRRSTPRRERARGKVERLIRPPRVGCTPRSLLEGPGLVFSLVSKDWPTAFAMLSRWQSARSDGWAKDRAGALDTRIRHGRAGRRRLRALPRKTRRNESAHAQNPSAERHRRPVEPQRRRPRLARPDDPGQPGLRRQRLQPRRAAPAPAQGRLQAAPEHARPRRARSTRRWPTRSPRR